jgi:hypothetical protein
MLAAVMQPADETALFPVSPFIACMDHITNEKFCYVFRTPILHCNNVNSGDNRGNPRRLRRTKNTKPAMANCH